MKRTHVKILDNFESKTRNSVSKILENHMTLYTYTTDLKISKKYDITYKDLG